MCAYTLTYTCAGDAPNRALSVEVSGLETGDPRCGMMGVYDPMRDANGAVKVVNGRPVYESRGGGGKRYLFHASNGSWYICVGKEPMEAGRAVGVLTVSSSSMSADAITGTWKVDDGSKWVDAPKVKVAAVNMGGAGS